jgi:hypothetical protein
MKSNSWNNMVNRQKKLKNNNYYKQGVIRTFTNFQHVLTAKTVSKPSILSFAVWNNGFVFDGRLARIQCTSTRLARIHFNTVHCIFKCIARCPAWSRDWASQWAIYGRSSGTLNISTSNQSCAGIKFLNSSHTALVPNTEFSDSDVWLEPVQYQDMYFQSCLELP